MKFLERGRHRIFVYGQPVDMRKGFTGLEVLIRHKLHEDPLSGDLFVFINRRGTLLKCFLWDRTGYVIIAKRLERGKFRLRNKAYHKGSCDTVPQLPLLQLPRNYF